MTHTTIRPSSAPTEVLRPPAAPTGGTHVLAVLETARAVLARGWMQDGWYRTAPRSWWGRMFGPIAGPDEVEAACLVAAVTVAGHDGGAFLHVDRDAGPAVDRVWEALQEARHGRYDRPPGAVAPLVRRARIRELVSWNDERGRTREDVLGLVDRAISRTILAEVR